MPIKYDINNPASRYRAYNVISSAKELGFSQLTLSTGYRYPMHDITVWGDYSITGIRMLNKYLKFTNRAKIILDIADDIDLISNRLLSSTCYSRFHEELLITLGKVEAVTVSSFGLLDKYSKLCSNVHYLPDVIDVAKTTNIKKIVFNQPKEIVRFFWVGFRDNLFVLDDIFKIFKNLDNSYAGRYELLIMSSIDRSIKYRNSLNNKRIVESLSLNARFIEWDKENVHYVMDNVDIALAPVVEGASKSNNKLIMYLACGIPTIASNTVDYHQVYQKTKLEKFLCDDYTSWENTITQAICLNNLSEYRDVSKEIYQLKYSNYELVKQWLYFLDQI